MAYIGNTPEGANFYTLGVEKFSGTGACTQFTLGRTISDANTITVVVNGITQVPGDSYSVTGGVLTFTEAPDATANNIVITYLATSVYTQIIPGQLAVGSVTAPTIASGAVTTQTIASGAVTGEKISTPADIFDDAFLFGGM